jgi:pantetheine-phosphate adenylyltransferase
MEKMFETVAVGGTFDLFHNGHLALLKKAFEVSNRVLVGVTSDEFVENSRKPHDVGSYDQRVEELKAFLERNNFLERAEIIPLTDSYGVTLSDERIDALVVSVETEPVAVKINNKRKSLGLDVLPVVVVKMVLSEDHYPISSTRIWFEEIDREGNLL